MALECPAEDALAGENGSWEFLSRYFAVAMRVLTRYSWGVNLVSFMKTDALERGFRKMELDMWEFNDGALAFYESVGFKTYRRYMDIDL